MEWRHLMAFGQSVSLASTFPFLDELIREDRADDASRVWREALAAAGHAQRGGEQQSLIWNGDFKQDFANGGLGWRWSPVQGATIDFDSQPDPDGLRAVRLDFTGGRNINLGEPVNSFLFSPQPATISMPTSARKPSRPRAACDFRFLIQIIPTRWAC